MVQTATEQADVLMAVRDRLIKYSPLGLNESTCFLALDPYLPDANKAHDVFVTIAPEPGTYDDGVHEGAGVDGTFEYTGVIVTIFTRIRTDQAGVDAMSMTDLTRGTLRKKKRILEALSGHCLEFEGNQILVNLMAPLKSTPTRPEYEDFRAVSISFSTDFEWDLTDESVVPD